VATVTLTLRFEVCPIGKGRPRFAKTGHAYTPKETREYENIIASLARQQYAEPPVTIPISIGIVFTFATDDKRRWGMVKHTRPDLDNCIKAVTDPLNGIVWHDDAQIYSITATKVWGSVSSVVLSVTPSIDKIIWHDDAPLVSQSVIDASDKLLADIEAKVNADPVLKKKCDKVRKDALASIARAKKRELSNCSNEVISGEEYLRGKE
jgi:Holliday junction resolvase RusA-like endonuclease